MSPVAACPITTKVTEMPAFAHISFHLLLCKMMFDDQSDEIKVDAESVFARRVLPTEMLLNCTNRLPILAGRRWRGMKPAIVLAARIIEELVGAVDIFTHSFSHVVIRGADKVSLAIENVGGICWCCPWTLENLRWNSFVD